MGLPERSSLGKRGQWTADYFRQLPPEVRKPFKKQAKAEKAELKKGKGKGKGRGKADLAEGDNDESGDILVCSDTDHGKSPPTVPTTALSPEETMWFVSLSFPCK